MLYCKRKEAIPFTPCIVCKNFPGKPSTNASKKKKKKENSCMTDFSSSQDIERSAATIDFEGKTPVCNIERRL